MRNESKKASMTKAEARTQIERLAHFNSAPKNAGGWDDARDALIRYCRNLDHCKSAIDAYVDSPRMDEQGNPKFPSVYDIRLLCEKGRARRSVCETCNGDGFLPDTPAFSQGVRYERLKRCECDTQASPADRGNYSVNDFTDAPWFIPDLAGRPDMIRKWKTLATANVSSHGYPVLESQRKFAAKIIRDLEDHLGQAV